MSYEIVVSATNFTVDSNTTELAVTINAPATPTFTITNEVNSLTLTSLQTTASLYTDAVELVLADLNTFWKGEWTTGTYYRGDIVSYQYSQYFLDDWNANVLAPYTSTVVPPSDATWIRFNWHEAPFAYLTVTNSAFIGQNLYIAGDLEVGGGTGGRGLTINNTATFNGIVNLNNTTTVFKSLNFAGTATLNGTTINANTLTVAEKFTYNGLEYPYDKGLFGQVLFTNGADKADWVNLGELVFWSLSNNLYTNGFDIYTNALNQDLGIGVSDNNTFANSPSYLKFFSNGNLQVKNTRDFSLTTTNTATFYAGNTIQITGGLRTNIVGATATFAGGLMPSGSGLFSQGSQQLAGGIEMTRSRMFMGNTGTTIISAGPTTGQNTNQDAWVKLTSSGAGATRTKNVQINGDVALNGTSRFTVTDAGITFSDGTTQTSASVSTSTFIFTEGLRSRWTSPDVVVSLNTATTSTIGGVKVGTGLSINTGTAIMTLNTATTSTLGGIKAGDGVIMRADGTLDVVGTFTGLTSIVAGTGTFVSTSSGDVVIWINPKELGKDYEFKAGVGLTATTVSSYNTTTATYSLLTATTATLGGIIVGENLAIDEFGVLSATGNIQVGNVSLTQHMDTNGFDIRYDSTTSNSKLSIGTTSTRLAIDTDTFLNLTTNSVSLAADSDTKLDLSTTAVNLYADSNTYLNITATAIGLINDTNRLDIDGSQIALKIASADKINVTSTRSRINGFFDGQSTSTAVISSLTNFTIDSTSGKLVIGTRTPLNITTTTAVIAVNTATIGESADNSTLRVQRIYNYAGTYAPFFPAGVQFQDNTVQFTAYQPDLGLL